MKRKLYFFMFSILKKIIYRNANIKTNFIYPGVNIGRSVTIEAGSRIYSGVTIGDFTFINFDARVEPNTKSIGKFCSISHSVKIGLGPHPLEQFSTSAIFYSKKNGYIVEDRYDEYQDKGYSIIGNDVLIGANALIMAGVVVADGAVVGAGSVVTKDVPPYAIVAGVPAKIIDYRFSPETIEALQRSCWWDLDIEVILKCSKDSNNVDEFIKLVTIEKNNAH